MKQKTKSKLIAIPIILVLIYVVGHIVASLVFTNPLAFIVIIIICAFFTMFGIIKIPFDIVKIGKLIRRKYS